MSAHDGGELLIVYCSWPSHLGQVRFNEKRPQSVSPSATVANKAVLRKGRTWCLLQATMGVMHSTSLMVIVRA